MKCWVPPVLASLLLGAPTLRADYDIAMSTGFLSITIDETIIETDKKEKITLSGQSYSLQAFRGLGDSVTVFGGAQAVAVYLEKNRSHIVRYGPSLGVAYHLLGGVRRMTIGSEEASVTRSWNYSLSAIGISQLDVLGTQSETHEFKGSVVNVRGGIELLVDYSRRHSFGLATYSSFLTLPMGTKLINESDKEVSISWRIWVD
jgi:hypothetical protein